MKKILISMMLFSAMSFASFGADFCVGDNLVRTVGGGHYDVKIVEIYEDGTADISYTNGQYNNANISINELSRALERLEGVQVGAKLVRTVGSGHYNVTILKIYKDRTVDISYVNGQYNNANISIDELSRALKRSGDVQVGAKLVRTLGAGHYDVKIIEIYEDGTADISYTNGQYNNANISINELSRSLERLEGIQVGAKLVRTVGGGHYNVTILKIYKDRTVDISYVNGQYNNANISIDELSRARNCTDSESCSK